MSIPFEAIAAALLSQADTLVPAWLPHGKRRGREWICGDLYGDTGDSCRINLETGKWADFASDSSGRDLIALYAEIHGMGQGDAARHLESLVGVQSSPPPRPAAPAPVETTDPAPAGTSVPSLHHSVHGDPSASWLYETDDRRPWVWIARYDPPGARKEIIPWTWNGSRWRPKGCNAPRPLFHLPELAARPDGNVLVVEGEKAAVAAADLLSPSWVVTTWQGGSKAVSRTDWTPLAGRKVTIWPDHDAPGRAAAAEIVATLTGKAAALRVIDAQADALADGWDAADAVSGGLTRESFGPWASARVKDAASWAVPAEPAAVVAVPTPEPPRPVVDPVPVAPPVAPRRSKKRAELGVVNAAGNVVPVAAPQAEPEPSAALGWRELDLSVSDKSKPYANLDNVARILARHPSWKGQIWLDEFSHRVMWADGDGSPREWGDPDDIRLTLWIQRAMGIPEIKVSTVADGVNAAAQEAKRHPLRDWLNSLTWDGEDRLRHLFPDGFAADRTAYSEAVGRCFMVSLVARALCESRDGIKVDTVPVIEGSQGIGKSTGLRILGGDWYSEIHEEITGKDFLQAIEGKWLVEISELHAFRKAEVERIKGILSCQVDTYRKSYGRRSGDYPRRCVFAGTTNRDDWVGDETGARRFWPIAARETNIDWLKTHREQLFAEAVARFRRKESWWDVPDEEAKAEQEARRQADAWESIVLRFVTERPARDPQGGVSWYPRGSPLMETTTGEVLAEAIGLPESKWSRGDQLRVASALRLAGYKPARSAGRRFWQWRGDRAGAVSPHGKSGQQADLI